MIHFEIEGIEALDDLLPLLNEHAKEVNWHDVKISPNRTYYETLIANGMYYLFTVRDEGQLVGYAGFFVTKHPHYENYYQATSDVIYVRPFYRRGCGGKLIDFAEQNLRVNSILYYVTVRKDYSSTLKERGYKKIESTWCKKIV